MSCRLITSLLVVASLLVAGVPLSAEAADCSGASVTACILKTYVKEGVTYHWILITGTIGPNQGVANLYVGSGGKGGTHQGASTTNKTKAFVTATQTVTAKVSGQGGCTPGTNGTMTFQASSLTACK